MKRNVIGLVKFMCMAVLVVVITVFTFKLVRPLTISHQPLPAAHRIEEARQNNNPLPLEPNEVIENTLIDWHDYGKIVLESQRKGVGEQGKAAQLPESDKILQEKLYEVNGFNGALSDKISLHRAIPDIRHPGCKKKKYYANLPSVSVVVPFHNEHWSTLLRTAHSVLDRSPTHLLKEIILVDDFSSKDFLKDDLDKYVATNMTKVQVVRLPSRQGLILARLAGAKKATGEVLVFLDSHCEANINWLPPLLHPIAEDYKTCVCPFIDVVAYDTFEYRAQDEGARGAFDWELFYKRLPLLSEDLKHPTEPFESPVMAGGLFAISSRFFWELGGYDEGLQIWGGEQYELSFKIWQCGGRMYDAPCSRVGHIYRKFAPFPNPGKGDFVGKNYRRVAEVWMDEYKEFLYLRRPHYLDIDPGDLTQQKALREKLKCKSFKWFMEEIAFDLVHKYPPIEPEDYAKGEIRSVIAPSLCVDTKKLGKEERFGVDDCVSDKKKQIYSHEQEFRLTWTKDIRPKDRTMCWDVSDISTKSPVTLYGCHGQGGNQLWRYKPEEKWLVHGGNPRCLELDVVKKEIFVTKCNSSSAAQKWDFKHVFMERLNQYDKERQHF